MIRIYKDQELSGTEVIKRYNNKSDIGDTVSEIIDNVRKNGDAALREYTKRFDKAELNSLEVTRQELEGSTRVVDPSFREILKKAKQSITAFHSAQKRNGFVLNDKQGIVVGQKVLALARVGLYVPGGTASYPSSVLMNAVPAKIAGVGEIIMTTPADKNGNVSADILAAAYIAGVDRVFKLGGAQAIAALSYGTQSVPRVDKIVGPGNAYVAEAKRQVYGIVDIDMIAGPSEILVIADEQCNADVVAADMLSQAEHDKKASAILITTSAMLAADVAKSINNQLDTLSRKEIAAASIDNNGKIIVVENISRAIELANEVAPEHLELCVDSPFDYLDSIRNAGSIFLGRNTPEALGDYMAGPNHTLPTSGTARFSSPLSVDDFVKKSQFIYYTRQALGEVYGDVASFAKKEGLTAHARSACIRFDGDVK